MSEKTDPPAPIPFVPKWRAALTTDNKGNILPTATNALTILSKDPELRDTFARNAFNAELVLKRALPAPVSDLAPQPGPYPRQWTASDAFLLLAYLQRFYSHRFQFEAAERAMTAVAAASTFHPVTQWIETIAWDGRPRIDMWLINAFKAPDTEYIRAVGPKFLIAAVRRVRHPGCQFDHMLVLEGAQGIGKSRCCRTLFGDLWFTDDLPHDFRSKDSPQALLGVWGVELAEVAQITSSYAETEIIKAFISRREDRFRPPYGRGFLVQPRQSVFIGTTNRTDWLSDETGNRRFWPVPCILADFEWIAANRNHLWAEAAAREAAGESIWLDTQDLQDEAAIEQEKRLDEDVWTPRIRDYLVGRTIIQIADVLAGIGVPTDRQDKRYQMRAAKVVSKEGWLRVTKRTQKTGKPQKVWVHPLDYLLNEEDVL